MHIALPGAAPAELGLHAHLDITMRPSYAGLRCSQIVLDYSPVIRHLSALSVRLEDFQDSLVHSRGL